jgi:hypothetical protein
VEYVGIGVLAADDLLNILNPGRARFRVVD